MCRFGNTVVVGELGRRREGERTGRGEDKGKWEGGREEEEAEGKWEVGGKKGRGWKVRRGREEGMRRGRDKEKGEKWDWRAKGNEKEERGETRKDGKGGQRWKAKRRKRRGGGGREVSKSMVRRVDGGVKEANGKV